VTATKPYFLCTLPRSGSWWLADLLESTNIAGRPREYFELPKLRRKGHFPKESYLRRVRRTATTANGVLGMKFHWHQFDYFTCMMRRKGNPQVPTAELVEGAFPGLRYIWLTRRDKVRQAVSYYRAIQTGEWWRIVDETAEPAKPSNELTFDFAAIEHLENFLKRHDHLWQRYFEESHLDPLVLVYEEMTAGIEAAVREALRFLDIAFPDGQPLATILERQADSLSEQWAEEYKALKRARSAHTMWFLKAVSISSRQASSAGKDSFRIEAVLPSSAQPEPRAGRRTNASAINGREYCIAAPQRSGHHAIINWLAAQCRGSILFLNDAQPATNPFITCTITSRLDLPGAPKLERARMNLFDRRDFLFVSYEDRRWEEVFCQEYESNHDVWVGASGERRRIIVLRDAFNTFASRMRASWMRHKLIDDDGRHSAVQLWKSYAKAVIQGRVLTADSGIFINFNRWFGSLDYRRQIVAKLGLEFSDEGRRVVQGRYGGSSFDGVLFDGAADQMSVLERWKNVAHDPVFRDLFRDRELIELSYELFGPIPGTETFIGSEAFVLGR
jgi:LPS sulfotransferase NodH